MNNDSTDFNIGFLISASLKGISQVMLIENSISGLIILIAITLTNYKLGIIAFLAAIIGTSVGVLGGSYKKTVGQGLFAYNSVLIAMALSLFLEGYAKWIIAIVGAAFVAVLTAAMMHLFSNISIPVLTFPYIITTWLTLLASYHLSKIRITSGLVAQDLSNWKLNISGNISKVDGLIKGIGQIYFLDAILAGVLILIAAFWANWRFGIYTLLGTFIGWITAYLLGGEHTLMNLGLYGFNAILTIIGVSLVFNDSENWKTVIIGCIAAAISVPFTAGINTFLSIYGLPTLSVPFVIISWIFTAAKKVLPKI